MVRPRPRPGRGEQIVELYGLWGQAALSRIDENELEHLHLGWGRVLVGCSTAASGMLQLETLIIRPCSWRGPCFRNFQQFPRSQFARRCRWSRRHLWEGLMCYSAGRAQNHSQHIKRRIERLRERNRYSPSLWAVALASFLGKVTRARR